MLVSSLWMNKLINCSPFDNSGGIKARIVKKWVGCWWLSYTSPKIHSSLSSTFEITIVHKVILIFITYWRNFFCFLMWRGNSQIYSFLVDRVGVGNTTHYSFSVGLHRRNHCTRSLWFVNNRSYSIDYWLSPTIHSYLHASCDLAYYYIVSYWLLHVIWVRELTMISIAFPLKCEWSTS